MAWFLKRQLSHDKRITLSTQDITRPWKLVTDDSWDKSIFSYIPQKNERIYLSEKIGVSYGGESAEEYEICHPDNMQLFEEAAHIF